MKKASGMQASMQLGCMQRPILAHGARNRMKLPHDAAAVDSQVSAALAACSAAFARPACMRFSPSLVWLISYVLTQRCGQRISTWRRAAADAQHQAHMQRSAVCTAAADAPGGLAEVLWGELPVQTCSGRIFVHTPAWSTKWLADFANSSF